MNALEHCCNRIEPPRTILSPCTGVHTFLYESLLVCMPRCRCVCTREDLTYCKNSNVLFALYVCMCNAVIQAVCFPSAIKSNRPSSPSEAHSKTTTMTDSCRGRCMQTQAHKKSGLGFICHSEAKQHGCELDLNLACIMHSSMCALMSAKERKGDQLSLAVHHIGAC